eukprot:5576173-Alexandrium_andersonii.AAC.1
MRTPSPTTSASSTVRATAPLLAGVAVAPSSACPLTPWTPLPPAPSGASGAPRAGLLTSSLSGSRA